MNKLDEIEIRKALFFATAAHAAVGQKRKYTGEDYIVHPIDVAARVRRIPGATTAMVISALLHDVVEDTAITISIIRQMFGDEVADMVSGLTEVSRPEDGNRAFRKAKDRAHLAQQPPRTKSVKLADIDHNVRNIAANDPGFAVKYLGEKQADLAVLSDGDPELFAEVSAFIDAFFRRNSN